MIWFRYWPIVAVLLGMFVLNSGWAAILLYHAGLVAGIWQKRKTLRELRWRSPVLITLGLAIGGLAAAPLVYWGLPWFTSASVGADLAERLDVLGLTGWSLWLFALYFVTIHPVLEESGWRGALLVRSRKLHANDVEFAAYHLFVLYWLFPGNWLLLGGALITLAATAWLWRQLRDAQGMVVVIAFHAAADLAVLLAAGLLAKVPFPPA